MRKKGFTLLEIMVSMVILALLAAGFFSVLVSARFLVARSRHRFEAIEIAKREVENMRELLRQDVWDIPGSPLWPGWWTPPQTVIGMGGTTFMVSYRVQNNTGCTDCRRITVQVTWNETAL